ncbi:MAG TPA: hypothetical protein VKA05_07930, partial [Acidimicrobiales bacterium]|nr:hypothetical protein [Acidimicrobiales bacterium]
SVAAELALGSLSGAARSAALSHLDGCDDCRTLVEDLATAADALLLVAPEVDAPAGFEVRLLARLRAAQDSAMPSVAPVVRLRQRTRAVFAAAAAAIVIAAAGVGVGVAVAPQRTQPAASGQVRVATLRSGTQAAVGNVVLTAGSPSWVLMTLHRPGWSGWVYCVVTVNGQSKRIGSFWVHDGLGSWAVRLSGSGSAVTSAQVETSSGSVYATAEFAT